MSPMNYYLYFKLTSFWVKPTDLHCIQCKCQFVNKTSWKWRQQLFWRVRVHSAGTTYFSENHFKAMFSFCWISVLL